MAIYRAKVSMFYTDSDGQERLVPVGATVAEGHPMLDNADAFELVDGPDFDFTPKATRPTTTAKPVTPHVVTHAAPVRATTKPKTVGTK